nr:peptide transporter [uncultured Agathobacter sp.]
MRNIIRLTDLKECDIEKIYSIADEIQHGKYKDCLKGKTIVMFFPNNSIRTRVTFEKGIYLLGGQTILFPPDTLDKKEDMQDVIGYLNNWADGMIVRHKNIKILEKMAEYSDVPVISAMTDFDHPCEILSDIYALSKIRKDYKKDRFLFCGDNGNIGYTWKEAAEILGFEMEQCCDRGYEIEGIKAYHDIYSAIAGKDIICTDSIPVSELDAFKSCCITKKIMDKANKGAILNPCPPFYRGELVSDDVIGSDYFVGYDFKKCLLEVQQAVVIYCMEIDS